MEKIRFAIVGYGHIGRRHAEMIASNPNAELVAVADIEPGLQQEVREKWNAGFYSSIEQLLEACPQVDVVNICTPNGLHASQSVAALQKKHHVVCEKPMGLTKPECERVIFTALHMARHVFVVMQNRYSPPARWLKSIVNENLLGEIYLVQINCYWNRDDRYYKASKWKGRLDLDGGPLYTQFSHFIDIMYWLFGDIKNINSRFANFSHQTSTEFEDSGFVNFEFVNGGIGTLNYSTSVVHQNFESSITIIGSKGTIKVGGQYMDKLEYCHIENVQVPELPPASPPNDYGFYKGSASNHHYVIDNVVETLRGNTLVTTNALEGMKVVEIIERIYEKRQVGA